MMLKSAIIFVFLSGKLFSEFHPLAIVWLSHEVRMQLLRIMFLLTLVLVMSDAKKGQLLVRTCPSMPMMENVDKEKLLGYWYAYGTTPLPFKNYQRRCASYNVKDSPYFKTNILFTNYKHYLVTYSCLFDKKAQMYRRKLRLLTRTRTPMRLWLMEVLHILQEYKFPLGELEWPKTEAFCFEWYQLNFEMKPRPMNFQAPFSVPGELGR